MRKLISLGLLAISFAFAAQSVLAYDVEECEFFKGGTPGLYGLCLAFVNAGNENARDRIRANYVKKRAPEDPATLDEFFDGPQSTCPCWGLEELAAVGEATPYGCDVSEGFRLAAYDTNLITFEADAQGLPEFPSTCFYLNVADFSIRFQDTTPEEHDACWASVEALIAQDFGEVPCVGTDQE